MTAPRLLPAKASTFLVTFGLALTIVWIVIGAVDVAGTGDDWRIFWGAGHSVGTPALIRASRFAYTPGAAWLLWPFAHLPIAAGYYIYVVIMVACATAAAWLASKIYSLPFQTTAFMAFAWAPFTIAICLGQNSPVALLCVMLATFGIVRRNQSLAGIGLGLLLYKPSDAVAVAFLLLILRQWRALAVAAAFALAWYLSSAAAAHDWLWPTQYVTMLSALYGRDVVANADYAISVPTLLTRFGVPNAAAWLAGAILLLASTPLLLRVSRLEAASVAPLIGVAASPHAWGYEAILALPFLWLAAARLNAVTFALLAVAYVVAPFYLFARVIHFNVLTIPVLGGVALWMRRRI